jgi:aldose 1-epimerase
MRLQSSFLNGKFNVAVLCWILVPLTPAIPITAAAAADTTRLRELRVEKSLFGTTAEGQAVELYTLGNARGMVVKVMTHGATLIAVEAPDRDGKFANVTLHLDTFADYMAGHPLFGSVVGRYANRIAGAKFTIDGKEYRLAANSAPHHIHGGAKGFQKLVWSARSLKEKDSVGVELSLTSPDGDEGYPGTLKVKMVYRLNNDNELTLEYTAETDKPTHVNLTNHTYWNLGGAGSGKVLGQTLMLYADRYLLADDKKIPSGELQSVKGTPMDFTTAHPIGARIQEVSGGGYDHCYVVNRNPGDSLALTARVVDPKSGRVMEVRTTQPGVQIYTANYLSDKVKAAGAAYGPHHAVCLETQSFPDSPNKPQFPSSLLRPGQTYHQVTVHKFSVEK